MSLTTLAKVEKVDTKTGEKDGKSWKGYFLHANGERYATFDGAIGDKALSAVGHTATIFYDKTSRGNKLENIEVSPENDAPDPVSHSKPDGQPDWDLIGLHKTRCALWQAAIGALATVDVPANQVAAFARELVLAAEVDIFHRKPADDMDDIPF